MANEAWDPNRPIPGYAYTEGERGNPRLTRFRVSHERHRGTWRVFELMQRGQRHSYWPDKRGFASWEEAFKWAYLRAVSARIDGVRIG